MSIKNQAFRALLVGGADSPSGFGVAVDDLVTLLVVRSDRTEFSRAFEVGLRPFGVGLIVVFDGTDSA